MEIKWGVKANKIAVTPCTQLVWSFRLFLSLFKTLVLDACSYIVLSTDKLLLPLSKTTKDRDGCESQNSPQPGHGLNQSLQLKIVDRSKRLINILFTDEKFFTIEQQQQAK